MFRALVAFSLVTVAAMAAPINLIDDVPAEYRDLIPVQVKEFLAGLTEEEMKVFKDISTNRASYKSSKEIEAVFQEKSPILFDKIGKFIALFNGKLAALRTQEAKTFATETLNEAKAFIDHFIAGTKPSLDEIKTKILRVFEKYNALSADANADLEKQFPITASVFKNEKFQEIARKLLNKN